MMNNLVVVVLDAEVVISKVIGLSIDPNGARREVKGFEFGAQVLRVEAPQPVTSNRVGPAYAHRKLPLMKVTRSHSARSSLPG